MAGTDFINQTPLSAAIAVICICIAVARLICRSAGSPRLQSLGSNLSKPLLVFGALFVIVIGARLVTISSGVTASTPRAVFCNPAGYWQSQSAEWPTDQLRLGSQTYTKPELQNLLAVPTAGDASVILARQLIVAKLNSRTAVAPAAVVKTMALADDLFVGIEGRLPLRVEVSDYKGQGMVWVAAKLAAYNATCERTSSAIGAR